MILKMVRTSIVTILLLSLCTTVMADIGPGYWPNWRGPECNGSTPYGNPPITWSDSENIKWKVGTIGQNTSTPIIWGDQLIYQTAIPTKALDASQVRPPGRKGMGKGVSAHQKFDVICLNRQNGQLLWQTTVKEALPHQGHHKNHGFASFSPITDGKHIWASFGSRGLHCLDMNGEIIWSRDLVEHNIQNGFGEGGSIALVDNAIIAVCDHEGQSWIFAIDKDTSQTLWKKERQEISNWATPAVARAGGKTQIITNGTKLVRSYDLKNGDVIWQSGGQTKNAIPSPIIAFGNAYCTSGYSGSLMQAVNLNATGSVSETNGVSWQINKGTPYIPSPVLYKGKLYFCKSNRGEVSCFQAETGKMVYSEKSLDGIKSIYASPVAVADRIYFIDRKGTAVVINGSNQFEIIATNTLDDEFDASPVVVGDEIYLNGKKFLYCIAKK